MAVAAPIPSSPEGEVDDPRQRAVRLSQPRSSLAEGLLVRSPEEQGEDTPIQADAAVANDDEADADNNPDPRIFPAAQYDSDTQLDQIPLEHLGVLCDLAPTSS